MRRFKAAAGDGVVSLLELDTVIQVGRYVERKSGEGFMTANIKLDDSKVNRGIHLRDLETTLCLM